MANRRKTAVQANEAANEQAETKEIVEGAATFTEEQVREMIAQAVAEAVAKQQEDKTAEIGSGGMVTLQFFDEVNDHNLIYLGENGKYGQIIGKRWTGQVPKMAFIGDFRTPLMQKLLENRNMIVLDGLTDEERKLYGVNYVQGEYIDNKLYESLLRMPEEDLLDVYRALCPEWRRMVAVKFADAYAQGKLRVTREALLALNRESRKANKSLPKDDPRRNGDFWGVIQQMNYAEGAEDDE